MALVFLAGVTRNSMGLGDLNINDGIRYKVSNRLLGGAVTWDRNVATSPWVDGDVTVSRRRPNVSEEIEIHVYGDNHTALRANIVELVQAFSQHSFNLAVYLSGQIYQYQCEAADYQMSWEQSKIHGTMSTLTFTMPRRPTAVLGV